MIDYLLALNEVGVPCPAERRRRLILNFEIEFEFELLGNSWQFVAFHGKSLVGAGEGAGPGKTYFPSRSSDRDPTG